MCSLLYVSASNPEVKKLHLSIFVLKCSMKQNGKLNTDVLMSAETFTLFSFQTESIPDGLIKVHFLRLRNFLFINGD